MPATVATAVAEVAVAEGNPAGAVDDQTIEGETAAATHRAEEARAAAADAAGEGGAAADQRLTVALDTEDELAHLVVHASLTAADEAAVIAAVVEPKHRSRAAEEQGVVVEVVVGAERAAGIGADIEARPGEDRDRRDAGQRRRPARGQVGGISRTRQRRRGDRRHEKLT